MSLDGQARQRAKLGEDVARFNFLLASYVHTNWLSALPNGAEVVACAGCERSQRSLSHYLLDAFELRDQYVFEIEESISPIVLLDAPALRELAYFAGLTLNASRVRQIISRDQVRALKKSLGEEAYVFSLKRAAFIRAEVAIARPEETDEDFVRSASAVVERCGRACVELALGGQPHALSRRVELKLSAPLHTSSIALTGSREAALSLLNRLRRETVS